MTFDIRTSQAKACARDYATGTKGESAAASSTSRPACKVSQKVLLTVMQKEQHLVTYRRSQRLSAYGGDGVELSGYRRLRSHLCRILSAGVWRAKGYRYYLEHEEQYGYTAHNLNYIQYHPNAACGGARYIENKATALSTSIRPTSRTSPHWPPATVPAIPAPVMATATSRLSTPAGSVRREV